MDASRASSTLGVSNGATYDEVRRAYRRTLRAHHPDTGLGDPQAITAIRTAYHALADKAPRAVAVSPQTLVPGTYGYGRAPQAPRTIDLYA
jgi:DnaJ-class molecular chaperone